MFALAFKLTYNTLSNVGSVTSKWMDAISEVVKKKVSNMLAYLLSKLVHCRQNLTKCLSVALLTLRVKQAEEDTDYTVAYMY